MARYWSKEVDGTLITRAHETNEWVYEVFSSPDDHDERLLGVHIGSRTRGLSADISYSPREPSEFDILFESGGLKPEEVTDQIDAMLQTKGGRKLPQPVLEGLAEFAQQLRTRRFLTGQPTHVEK